jgi:hypothetical protein
MRKILAILVLLAGCSFQKDIPPVVREVPQIKATRTPIPAIANLGMARYAKVARDAHPKGFGNVTFTNTFGDAYPALDALLATGKVSVQEYNLLWKDDHRFSRRDFPFIVEEAKKYVSLVNRYPDVGCIFSGATEHNLSKDDATALATAVLAVVPARCTYSNNPWVGKGAFIAAGPRICNEIHGWPAKKPNVPGCYIHNLDGTDAFDVPYTDVKKAFPDAYMLAVWTSQNNGKSNRNDTTPRPKRKFWPTTELIDMLAFLFTKQGAVSLPKNYTVKPKADQHMVPPEPRALKPVFILPYAGNVIELWAAGKRIVTSEPAQKFADGRWRYYFRDYGYKIVEKARTSVLGLWVRGKRVGKTNPGFRQFGE